MHVGQRRTERAHAVVVFCNFLQFNISVMTYQELALFFAYVYLFAALSGFFQNATISAMVLDLVFVGVLV